MVTKMKDGFTMPGEAGYETLTLDLAKKWGADAIRDSDGTSLSREILEAGYDIYSTICIIRGHNEWAKENRDKLQQVFLMTEPVVAVEDELEIYLMDGFFKEQFAVNDSIDARKYWQIFDRTANRKLQEDEWEYKKETGSVSVKKINQWHKYTATFLAYRIWEEISMYNHVTNHWEQEHLMPVDPVHKETQRYLLDWFSGWCEKHPHTSIVRFTSMFYNFVWIWGSSDRKRNLFTDWASYDFTVSPAALKLFEEEYGYALEAEDFVNQGRLHVTHMPAGKKKRDWMDFINRFVVGFGKELVDIAHTYGKKAYVFYDDSWVGLEPYGERFETLGFDGMIKCVFSGYEARLCSGVKTAVHELRMHPYLFPTGVSGKPSFLEGGNPKLEAQQYWQAVRRAVLRSPVERIGLGGYLHLVESKPDFVEYIAEMADEFRMIKKLHEGGNPFCFRPVVGVLHHWGSLRPWTLSGHFHETDMHDLTHINESLSGLPFEVEFIDFEDVRKGRLEGIDVIINAGYAGSAWSGGEEWEDDRVVDLLTEWVHRGGTFLGVCEPSALSGYDTFFRMAHVLGVDKDCGDRICHGRWAYETEEIYGLIPPGGQVCRTKGIYLTDGRARVLQSEEGIPVMTAYPFGQGWGIYLGGYRISKENIRLLQNLILFGAGEDLMQEYMTDNLYTECAYFPSGNALAVINNTGEAQKTNITVNSKTISVSLKPFGMEIIHGIR